MSLWLTKKRKSDLLDLADQLNIPADGLLKSELELQLATHLDAHADTLKSDPTFAPYYDTLAPTRSPVKRTVKPKETPELDQSLTEGPRSRRKTSRYVPGMTMSAESTPARDTSPPEPSTSRRRRIPSEKVSETFTTPSTSTGRTPRVPRAAAATAIQAINAAADATETALDTAAVVAETAVKKARKAGVPTTVPAVKRKLPQLGQKVLEVVKSFEVQQKAEVARDRVSNIAALQVGVTALEWAFLVRKLVPWTHAFATPSFPPALHDVKVPDLSILGTGLFWSAVWSWLVISVLVPAVGGYFFNLTQKSKRGRLVDPVVFAITKAVVTYAVLGYGWRMSGLVGLEGTAAVQVGVGRDVLWGGAAVGGVVGLYEAVLRK
ncbi:hypothetical protein BJ508DRAFT_411626 [Ascobolus immersus RN42]|uniref:SAP domain-containing protein n=1 Tax=Ascobolus immersus RN42 TaxID=1160509 RepID=A0A3N4IKW6_ASCIM|nr:hypothetical protein BJ508DRAFT_411626 [Ascobolus immersus RN42]